MNSTITAITEGKEWKTALYARLSRDDGDKIESDSIGNQKDLIRSYIKDKPDLNLVNTYEDDGFTGVNFDRPSFKRMIADIQNGSIDCVVVKDLSRLGRNYIETGKLLERFFPFMGVRFIAINDSYDSQNPNLQTDNLLIPFKNLMNDTFCADTSKKIRSQFDIKRKNGDYIGAFTAYGYMKDPQNKNRLIIDENAAQVVQDIFRRKIQGMSQQGISDKLNELGVPSPLEYKKASGSNYTTIFNTHHMAKWTPVAVGRILKNDLYIGILTQGISTTPNYKIKQRVQKSKDEWVRIEQSHEAIISQEDFVLVAGLLQKDTRIAPGEDSVYLFSGMLYCADCGQNLVRKYMGDRNKKYIYHVCSSHKKGGGCKSHLTSDKALHSAILNTVRLHIHECARISYVLEFIDNMPFHQIDAERLQKHIDEKQAELEKLNQRQIGLYEDFKDELISKDEYMSYKNVFASQSCGVEKALEQLRQELENIVNNRSEKCRWIEHFRKYQNIETLTRNVIVELIERITVFEGGRIEVRFHYQSAFENALQYIETLPTESANDRTVS